MYSRTPAIVPWTWDTVTVQHITSLCMSEWTARRASIRRYERLWLRRTLAWRNKLDFYTWTWESFFFHIAYQQKHPQNASKRNKLKPIKAYTMLSRKVRSLHLNPISSKWPLNWAFERCHFSVLARTGDERSTDAAVVASTSRQGGWACSRLSAMRFFSSWYQSYTHSIWGWSSLLCIVLVVYWYSNQLR